jgi:hypothetical protein
MYADIEGMQLNETPPIITPELLFHAREKLADRVEAEEAKSTPNKALVEELGVALQYISEDYGSTQASLTSLSEHNEITFDLLWALFPPNTTVYTRRNLLREHQICKLQKGEYGRTATAAKFYSLDLKYVSHDGEKLGWTENTLKIGHFDGARKVHNVTVVPLELFPDSDSIRAQLHEARQTVHGINRRF